MILLSAKEVKRNIFGVAFEAATNPDVASGLDAAVSLLKKVGESKSKMSHLKDITFESLDGIGDLLETGCDKLRAFVKEALETLHIDFYEIKLGDFSIPVPKRFNVSAVQHLLATGESKSIPDLLLHIEDVVQDCVALISGPDDTGSFKDMEDFDAV